MKCKNEASKCEKEATEEVERIGNYIHESLER
jgi:hypothetical protein